MKVPSRDISVVVQGPVGSSAERRVECAATLASVRRFLPDCELILSTWEGHAGDDLQADIVVESKDPEGWIDVNGRPCNVNRQIVSTLAGVRAATRRYVLKLRVDTPLESDEICRVEAREQRRLALFEERVTMSNVVLRNPARYPQLFTFSDLAQFGLKGDILQLWSADLVAPDHFRRSDYPSIRMVGNFVGYSALRVVPEQYPLEHQAATLDGDLRLHDPNGLTLKSMWNYERMLCECFSILDFRTCGVHFPKRTWSPQLVEDTFYTVAELKRLALIVGELNWRYRARYVRAWASKFVLCWVNSAFLTSFVSHILHRFAPGLGAKARRAFHRIRGDRNFGSSGSPQ